MKARDAVEIPFDGQLPMCNCGRLAQWRADAKRPRDGMWWCDACSVPVMGPLPTSEAFAPVRATVAGPLPKGWE